MTDPYFEHHNYCFYLSIFFFPGGWLHGWGYGWVGGVCLVHDVVVFSPVHLPAFPHPLHAFCVFTGSADSRPRGDAAEQPAEPDDDEATFKGMNTEKLWPI